MILAALKGVTWIKWDWGLKEGGVGRHGGSKNLWAFGFKYAKSIFYRGYSFYCVTSTCFNLFREQNLDTWLQNVSIKWCSFGRFSHPLVHMSDAMGFQP